jgi:hypothetical protein
MALSHALVVAMAWRVQMGWWWRLFKVDSAMVNKHKPKKARSERLRELPPRMCPPVPFQSKELISFRNNNNHSTHLQDCTRGALLLTRSNGSQTARQRRQQSHQSSTAPSPSKTQNQAAESNVRKSMFRHHVFSTGVLGIFGAS